MEVHEQVHDALDVLHPPREARQEIACEGDGVDPGEHLERPGLPAAAEAGPADDVQPGKVTSFPQAIQLKDDETVVFSWIVFKSREDRDRINKAVMEDPRLKDTMDPKTMPFDGMRMIFGGFQPVVDLSK